MKYSITSIADKNKTPSFTYQTGKQNLTKQYQSLLIKV